MESEKASTRRSRKMRKLKKELKDDILNFRKEPAK